MVDSPINFLSAPFSGPFAIGCGLITNGKVVNQEGLWLPTGWAKSGSISVEGSMSTLSLQVYGSNLLAQPLNQYTVTVSGSIVAADTIGIVFTNPNLPGAGTYQVNSRALTGGDTLTTAAAALALAINMDTTLAPLGFIATSAAAVITIQYPSAPQNQQTPQTPLNPPSNQTSIAGAKTGSGSEAFAIAVGTNGNTIGSAITTLSIVTITNLPRWMTARITTLTGAGANITADFSGAA